MNKFSDLIGNSNKYEKLVSNFFILNKKIIFQNLLLRYQELLKQIVSLLYKYTIIINYSYFFLFIYHYLTLIIEVIYG